MLVPSNVGMGSFYYSAVNPRLPRGGKCAILLVDLKEWGTRYG